MKYLNDVNYKDCVGNVFRSLNSVDFKIVKYNDAYEIEIQFINTGFETSVQLGSIKSGKVKDRYLPSVYGVGVLGTKYPITINGVKTKEYKLWKNTPLWYSARNHIKNELYNLMSCLWQGKGVKLWLDSYNEIIKLSKGDNNAQPNIILNESGWW